MDQKFSIMRVFRGVLVVLNLFTISLAIIYFVVPGADVKLEQKTLDLYNYVTGSNANILVETEDWDKKVSGPKIVSTPGDPLNPATLTFFFEGKEYSIKPQVAADAYWGAVHADRLVYRVQGVADELVVADYYRSYVYEKAQQSTLDSVLAQLRAIRDENKLDSDRYAELLTKYVQSIPYDQERAAIIDGNYSPAEGDPRFPIQVLSDNLGDCDEKVFLLAALLSAEGYQVSALLFEPELHMSLGLKSAGEGYKGSGYEYVETTGIGYVGEVPLVLGTGVVIESQPKVIHFNFEGKGYSAEAASEVAHILSERKRAAQIMTELKSKLDAAANDANEYNKYVDRYNTVVEVHNTMNNINEDGTGNSNISRFRDRIQAIEWLKTHKF